MALMKILSHPDPRLRVVTKAVTQIDDKLQQIIDDMIETMYDANGVGLASTQVGLTQRLCVIDVSREHNQPMVLINPQILERKDLVEFEEGCLSVPGHYDKLKRHNWVKIKYQDREGKEFELEGEGLLAECIQHELDHLDGKLYIDYLSSLKQKRIRAKLDKLKRQQRQET